MRVDAKELQGTTDTLDEVKNAVCLIGEIATSGVDLSDRAKAGLLGVLQLGLSYIDKVEADIRRYTDAAPN
ncbi:hypothetical protein [Pseudomonas sp. URMO17WK12:I2]|uniref:hypothetical protein n=1 Tax=Pseudomonas sp. URMO17WK12:I2 TaxID=1261623 RepID=UPI000DB2EA46|nr:hypothetical protein [Pseudomonas sp. URMO17WK12:I2]PZW49718.1 hypothetical protein F469_00522 [Pseudomonas sp. URMO17WK12:I2]